VANCEREAATLREITQLARLALDIQENSLSPHISGSKRNSRRLLRGRGKGKKRSRTERTSGNKRRGQGLKSGGDAAWDNLGKNMRIKVCPEKGPKTVSFFQAIPTANSVKGSGGEEESFSKGSS